MTTGITSDDMESKQIKCPHFFFLPSCTKKKRKEKDGDSGTSYNMDES